MTDAYDKRRGQALAWGSADAGAGGGGACGAAGTGLGVSATCQGSPGAGFFTLSLRSRACTFSEGWAPTESQ